jgi:hypothetical protein
MGFEVFIIIIFLCYRHLPLKRIFLRQKKNYEKFKYFTMQKYNLQKNPLKETKILQNIITP